MKHNDLFEFQIMQETLDVSVEDIYTFIKYLMSKISKICKADRMVFLYYDQTKKDFRVRIRIGEPLPPIESIYPLEKEVLYATLVSQQIIEDPKKKIGFDLYIPIKDNDLLVGVICLDDTRKERRFSALELNVLQIMSGMVNKILITRNKKHQLLTIDPLTSLQNRRVLDKPEDLFLGMLSVAMIDIDCFKSINDTYGHLAGDMIMHELGQFLLSKCRKHEDSVVRYGGDEFLILFSASPEKAKERLEDIKEEFRQKSFLINEGTEDEDVISEVTFSGGVGNISISFDPKNPKDIESMISKADKRLYVAKARGRNTIIGVEHQID